MPIRKPKPTSPGRRFVSYADFSVITKDEPEKTLTEGLRITGSLGQVSLITAVAHIATSRGDKNLIDITAQAAPPPVMSHPALSSMPMRSQRRWRIPMGRVPVLSRCP